MAEQDPTDKARDDGLVIGRITDEDVAMMRQRIGFPNPSLRKGILQTPWNTAHNADAVRRWSECMGDLNPLYNDADYASNSRWAGVVAPPGFEWSMGIDRNPIVSDELFRATRRALRGVQLFHSGAEYFYYMPIPEGVKIYKSEVVGSVEEKQSRFGGTSVIVDNVSNWWDDQDRTYVTSHRWFVHTERKPVAKDGADNGDGELKKRKTVALAQYSDSDLAEIERLYDAEYIRGADTLYIEDVEPGNAMPTMVKGPLTVTDMINFHMERAGPPTATRRIGWPTRTGRSCAASIPRTSSGPGTRCSVSIGISNWPTRSGLRVATTSVRCGLSGSATI